jgi:hypothetical protein
MGKRPNGPYLGQFKVKEPGFEVPEHQGISVEADYFQREARENRRAQYVFSHNWVRPIVLGRTEFEQDYWHHTKMLEELNSARFEADKLKETEHLEDEIDEDYTECWVVEKHVVKV